MMSFMAQILENLRTHRWPLQVALMLCLIETIVFTYLGVQTIVLAVRGDDQWTAAGVQSGVMILVVTALVTLGALQLVRGRRSGRAPVVTFQVLLVVVTLALRQVLAPWLIVTNVFLGLVIAVGVLLPSSLATTGTTRNLGAE